MQQPSFSISPPPTLIWFLLVDSATGEPFNGTRTVKVSIASSADVDDFLDVVKAKNSNTLSSVDAAELLVYKNKAAFVEEKPKSLKSSCTLDGLGETEEEALIVVVPSFTFERRLNVASSSKESNAMEIDQKPSIDDIIVEFMDSGVFKLIKSRSEENLAKSQNSTIDEESAKIESSSLFDERWKDVVNSLGIKMPYENVDAQSFLHQHVTVLVGVSGCGKSRTCIDIARQRPCLYFDTVGHSDIDSVLEVLVSCDLTGGALDIHTRKQFVALVLARLILLENKKSPDHKKAVSYQNSNSFQIATKHLMMKLLDVPIDILTQNVREKIIGYVVIFDEAQRLIKTLPERYMDSRGDRTRPLFRFLVKFMINCLEVPSFWCGTALRLNDIDFVASAAGDKPDNSLIMFTEFHHYSFDELMKVLKYFLGENAFNKLVKEDQDAVYRACYFLQGRPRLISRFLGKLAERCPKESFKDVLDSYLFLISNSQITNVSFKWFWNRVVDEKTKLRDITKLAIEKHAIKEQAPQYSKHIKVHDKKTPNDYCYRMLKMFLFRATDAQEVELSLSSSDGDLISTALISLKKIKDDQVTYYLAEPIVLEAALNLMEENLHIRQEFMEYCLDMLLVPLNTCGLGADARGKELDKFIALRFRLGWWKEIPKDDKAWNEIPVPFRSKFAKLDRPKYLAMEKKVDEKLLNMTFCNDNSPYYVLPAEKSGLDGCYRFMGYLGKSSFTPQNKSGDLYVGSDPRATNLNYTNLDNWFSSIKGRQQLIKPFKKINRSVPFLFFCGEWPFYGPLRLEVPKAEKKGHNWIIHLDLRSRLACYILGEEAVKMFSDLVSKKQRDLIPNIWG